jgi:thioredoxin reductase (NADPH)
MLTTEVDNFPGHPGIMGPELMQKMREHASLFGGEFVSQNVDSIDISSKPFKLIANGLQTTARSIIIATGAETVWLDVPGLSELIGRGISSCAPCDAPFFKNKKVAVVGGGDSAMEEALVLTKYASEVTIIHRRDAFRASAAMQQKVLANEKVKVLWNTEVVNVSGEGKLEGINIKNNSIMEPSNSYLEVDGLFVAIGHTPSTEIFKGKIDLDEKGFVKKYEKDGYSMATNIPGVFVAGDVHDHHYKQAITASGFGCMAAMDCLNYLSDLQTK